MFEVIGLTLGWRCKGEKVSVPSIFFIPKNNFGCYRVEKGANIKIEIFFQNFSLGGVKTEKSERNLSSISFLTPS